MSSGSLPLTRLLSVGDNDTAGVAEIDIVLCAPRDLPGGRRVCTMMILYSAIGNFATERLRRRDPPLRLFGANSLLFGCFATLTGYGMRLLCRGRRRHDA